MVDLRVTEEMKKRYRRSMAVGPYEDLPPHLRNHLVSITDVILVSSHFRRFIAVYTLNFLFVCFLLQINGKMGTF